MAENKPKLITINNRLTDIQPLILPKEGLMTFNSEGLEGSTYASRYPHTPSNNSGLTLGRGYDMSLKSTTQIKRDKLNPFIKEMLIDLKFRGDYTPTAREFLQKHVAQNNLEEFKKAMLNQNNWKGVPADRFKRRSDFIKAAK